MVKKRRELLNTASIRWRRLPLIMLVVFPANLLARQQHDHGVPEKVGEVSFPVSCRSEIQPEFNRGVALLHSFAYSAAQKTFQDVAAKDPHCAMAHWGVAMTQYHQLWDPPLSLSGIAIGQRAVRKAQEIGGGSGRERGFINALGLVYQGAGGVPYHIRAMHYQRAMGELASQNRNDVETQVFYALALLATLSPADKQHTNQKQAAALLEPLYQRYPRHPGIAHYLIHACDNAEMAPRGLAYAKAYAVIAPSVPHALHMPSHVFTRLGLWDDSIASNLAARDAAHLQGDTGEELHAMDYLVYAYLQSGREADAAAVIQQLEGMPKLDLSDFKIAYAATAMPVRYAVERRQWADAVRITPPAGAPPQVVAIAVWARGLALARSTRGADVGAAAAQLTEIEAKLHKGGDDYWAKQVGILSKEVRAWSAQAEGKRDEAVALMREAADEEDGLEKLPVTPGPVVPAREQLGDLLLEQNRPGPAYKEFNTALKASPGRRRAIQGAARAARSSGAD